MRGGSSARFRLFEGLRPSSRARVGYLPGGRPPGPPGAGCARKSWGSPFDGLRTPSRGLRRISPGGGRPPGPPGAGCARKGSGLPVRRSTAFFPWLASDIPRGAPPGPPVRAAPAKSSGSPFDGLRTPSCGLRRVSPGGRPLGPPGAGTPAKSLGSLVRRACGRLLVACVGYPWGAIPGIPWSGCCARKGSGLPVRRSSVSFLWLASGIPGGMPGIPWCGLRP